MNKASSFDHFTISTMYVVAWVFAIMFLKILFSMSPGAYKTWEL